MPYVDQLPIKLDPTSLEHEVVQFHIKLLPIHTLPVGNFLGTPGRVFIGVVSKQNNLMVIQAGMVGEDPPINQGS